MNMDWQLGQSVERMPLAFAFVQTSHSAHQKNVL